MPREGAPKLEEHEVAKHSYHELYKELTLTDYRLPGETPRLDREMQAWEKNMKEAGISAEEARKEHRRAREEILDMFAEELNKLDLKLPPAEVDKIRRKVQEEVTTINDDDPQDVRDLKYKVREFLGLPYKT